MTYRPMIRMGDHLRLSARRFPDRPCFVHPDGTSHTFAEVNGRVNRLASALAAAGVGKGDRIAVMAVDSAAYYEVLYASMKLGAVYVPLNNRLAEEEIENLVRRAEPAAVFVSTRYARMVRDVVGRVGGVRLLASFDGDAEFADYAALLASGEDSEPDAEILDTDTLGLAFTSGTTGLPKGVLQSQGMLKALVTLESVEYEMAPGEFRYTASPAFHIAGHAMIFLHVARGFPTLVLPQFDAPTTLRWMREGGLTGCFLVPTMIRRILDLPDARAGGFPELRTIIYGGEPMSATLLREAMDVFGCGFINAFGAATEGGLQGVLSTADHERAAAGETHLLGSLGRPPAGVEVRIVDENDDEVPPGVVGEVVSRSDAVMSGYLDMPEDTGRALRGGWFRAGDLARRDEDGYMYIAGRAKDMIIRGGENIYPVEIESVLSRYPGVEHAAVVGRPDERWGEVVVAVLTVAGGRTVDPGDVRRHCRAHLAAYKVPETVQVIEEMPVNASGKILKRELRRLLSR
ncbi:hypothetical protein E1281_14910 [Actinomadura sp. KC345]|uniref:class I adenylate-forming enzyme family protein n=1 Tax=Actinomadura sp. KC345 TaxID=2530371 RepID=UPI001043BC3D|nr:AMP-binding protein [Actinomadura sp. KC345]TDC54977.1 hypothetical protein E1281_14910 [Actinomadura sp. KC345]